MNEVWITGVGLQGALGDTEATWRALARDERGVRPTALEAVCELDPLPAAPAASFSPRPFLTDPKLTKYMSPASALAVAAAGQALEQAGLRGQPQTLARMALYVATGLIAFDPGAVMPALTAARGEGGQLDLAQLGAEGLRRCHPLLPFKMLLNMPLGLISIAFGLRGDNAVLYPGLDQGAVCLELALRNIQRGRLSCALVGGTVHGVSLLPVATLTRQGRRCSSAEAAAGFTTRHRGLAPGDGAAFLVLEAAEHAVARDAQPLCRLEAVGQRRSWATAATQRLDQRAELWDRLLAQRTDAGRTAPEQPPLLLSSGNVSAEEDRLEMEQLQQRFCGAFARSLDGALGFLGAAALPTAAALGSLALLRGGTSWCPLRPPGVANQPATLLLSGGDPDGACAAALLGAMDPGDAPAHEPPVPGGRP